MTKPKPHPIKDRWHCLKCGASGVSWGKDEHNLTLTIRRHHKIRSSRCDYERDFVTRDRIKIAA